MNLYRFLLLVFLIFYFKAQSFQNFLFFFFFKFYSCKNLNKKIIFVDFNIYFLIKTKTQSEPCQIQLLAKIVNGCWPFTIFANSTISDVCQGSEFTSKKVLIRNEIFITAQYCLSIPPASIRKPKSFLFSGGIDKQHQAVIG